MASKQLTNYIICQSGQILKSGLKSRSLISQSNLLHWLNQAERFPALHSIDEMRRKMPIISNLLFLFRSCAFLLSKTTFSELRSSETAQKVTNFCSRWQEKTVMIDALRLRVHSFLPAHGSGWESVASSYLSFRIARFRVRKSIIDALHKHGSFGRVWVAHFSQLSDPNPARFPLTCENSFETPVFLTLLPRRTHFE